MTTPARALGLWSATALVVGNMIGSGVFLLPAALAPFGAASLLGWGLSTVGALLLAVAFAGLGRRYPVSGGPYTYARIAFGDFIGFMMAWCYWISTWCAVAAIAVAFTGSVTSLLPDLLGTPARSAACSLAVLWLCTASNLAGVRSAGIAQLVTTILKLLPLIAIVVLGATAMNFAAFHPFNPSPNSLLDVTTMSAALALWALLGFESATIPAEHVHDAERTIPLATMIGIVVAAIVTVGACTVVLGLVPLAQLKDSPAPFADAARSLWGAGGSIVMAAAMAVSCLGALNGWILIQGQIPFAAARDRLFPRPFAQVDERGTPRTGLVIGSVLASLLVCSNYNGSLVSVFTSAALLATAACLLPYLFTAAAFWKLDATFAQRKAWRKPVALLGLIYSVWALIGTGSVVLLWGAGLLVAGVPVYFFMKRGRAAAAAQAAP